MTRRRRLIQAALGLACGRLAGVPLAAIAAPGGASGASPGASSPTSPGAPADGAEPAPPAHGGPPRVLRFAFLIAETGFDPAQVSDLYSRTVCAAIFDSPLQYQFLARPFQVRAPLLTGLPDVADDFRTFTFHLKPGIFFADDPVFAGKPRELTAADFVYTIKRHYDPRWKSNNLYQLENATLLGLSELRRERMAAKQPFDYDREVEGIQALDRYTFRFRMAQPQPRFLGVMTDPAWGAVAREVIEHYGDKAMEHPVGTGPFKLAAWRRASRIVLDRNPGFRDEFYDEEAPADDAAAVAAAKALKGRKLPMLDRVEIAIIEEAQPRWLAFLNGEHDVFDGLPNEFAERVIPNDQLAPNLRKRGISIVRYVRVDAVLSYFNMEDAVVGGYTPDKVALRRAISLGVDIGQEIRLVRANQAIPGQGLVAPGCAGYEPNFRSEMSEFDRGRAKALLDLFGYVDRDGDGWRELPDGAPLRIEYATQPDQVSRKLVEQWQKNMAAIGIRMVFKPAKWPENLKASSAGKLMMWGVAWSAGIPDADPFLALGYGPNKGQANKSRFDLAAFNTAYARQKILPNGPERQAAIDACQKLAVAYMPYKVHGHRIYTDLAQAWVVGYHRNVFTGIGTAWRYFDVDPARQPARTA